MNWTDVQGYFTEEDARDYRFLVSQLPDRARMVEIGSFRGKSLASIANLIISKNLEVWSVDIFDKVTSPDYVEPDVYAKKENMLVDFENTLKEFGLYEKVAICIDRSLSAAKTLHQIGQTFDLIFIDADHSYEAVKDDIMHWWPLLKSEGIMCGHDYDEKGESWPGVHKAVHELLGKPDFLKYVWAVRKTESIQGLGTNNKIFEHG